MYSGKGVGGGVGVDGGVGESIGGGVGVLGLCRHIKQCKLTYYNAWTKQSKCVDIWRASETLLGVTNGNRYIYKYVIPHFSSPGAQVCTMGGI